MADAAAPRPGDAAVPDSRPADAAGASDAAQPAPLESRHDWTYYAQVDSPEGKLELLMWLAPRSQRVRGLVLASGARLGQLPGDPTVRAALAAEEIGIVGFRGGPFTARFDPTKNDAALLEEGLRKLALASGFPEVEHAPLASYGHSVGGIFANEVAYWKPERFFAVIQDNAISVGKPAWASGDLKSVPLLALRGDKEQVEQGWTSTRDLLAGQRATGHPVNMILEAGAGHFSWTRFEAEYVARFLRAAARKRLPATPPAGPVTLRPLAEADGWLSDADFMSTSIKVASFASYAGDKTKALWHLDQEMAELWRMRHQGQWTKKAQTVSFGKATCDRAFNPPCATLTLGTDEVIDLGATSSSGLPVTLSFYNGPFRLDGGKVVLDACQMEISDKGWVVATQMGNDEYQAAEKVYLVQVRKKTAGTAQTLTFDPIGERARNGGPINLSGKSSSALSVGAYIVSGAVIWSGGKLQPEPFARGTSQVVVRYCQPGSATHQTAANVTDVGTLK